jgi:hypothetical protein
MSRRFVKSPPAPKITKVQGGAVGALGVDTLPVAVIFCRGLLDFVTLAGNLPAGQHVFGLKIAWPGGAIRYGSIYPPKKVCSPHEPCNCHLTDRSTR